jgi:hypothetical protein
MGRIPSSEPPKASELRRRIDECAPQLKDAAHQEAYEFRFPWELSRLREAGKRGVLKASKEQKDETLGLPFPQAASGEIKKATRAAAIRLRAQREGGDEPFQPTEEDIREALEVFSRQEWRNLIAGFERQDLAPLRSYLDAHRGELERWLGRPKFTAVYVSAVRRGLLLFLDQPGLKITPVTDPMWAVIFRQFARQLKMKGGPRPSKKRTADEMGGYRAIAEGLSQHEKLPINR